MCAAVGAGCYPGLAAAGTAMSATSQGWLPDPERHQAYQPLYASYRHRLASVSSLDGVSLSSPAKGAASRRAREGGR